MKHFLKKLFLGDPATNTISNDFHKDKRKENIRAIWHNEHHNDYGLEKIFRLFLAASQFVFPSSYIKHYLERYGTHYKDLAVDLIVVSKLAFPIFLLYFQLQHNHWLLALQIWLTAETLLHAPTLIFASDTLSKPKSYQRSMLLVFLNYLEILFAFAVIYGSGDYLNHPLVHWYDAIYFSFTTGSSMGFGDFVPTTFIGKLLVSIQAIIFFLFVVIFLNFFSSRMENKGYFDQSNR
jgi:hypothetical protein